MNPPKLWVNLGKINADPKEREARLKRWETQLHPVRGTTAAELFAEAERHAKDWDYVQWAEALRTAAPRSRRSKPCRYGSFGFRSATEERRRARTGSCCDGSQLLGSTHRAQYENTRKYLEPEPTALRSTSTSLGVFARRMGSKSG